MPVPKNKRGLTVKQDKFCREFAKTGNGTLAAKLAGYSERSAKTIAHENMTKPDVAEEVARHRHRLAERLDVSREKLINDAAHDAESASLAGDYSAANASRTFIAKAQGYLVERSLSVNVDLNGEHLRALQERMSRRKDGDE